LSHGLASSFRPRKYYTIPKDTVESVLEDLEQLADFFIIEFQRILFAENLVHTTAVRIDPRRVEPKPEDSNIKPRLSLLPLRPTG
jgi:hypothetical protein